MNIVEQLSKNKLLIEKKHPAHNKHYFFVPKNSVLKELRVSIDPDSHKGHFAKVGIILGKYSGAAHLSAYGALRAGAQKAVILGEDMQPSAHHIHFLYQSSSEIDALDCLVVGPGLSFDRAFQQKATKQLSALAPYCHTILFDAEGLELALGKDFKDTNIVLTPHPKEAARLLSCSVQQIEENRLASIERLAKLPITTRGEIIWVLKGSQTLVHGNGNEMFMFKGQVPTLAVGGTGDILSGTIAALTKEASNLLGASLLANSLMLNAGKLLMRKAPRGFFPTEIADTFLECW